MSFRRYHPDYVPLSVLHLWQGDVMLAENLVQLLGSKLVACFIHQVVPLSETATQERKGQVTVADEVAAGWPKLWREQKIFLGSDYISLAAEVASPGCLVLLYMSSILRLKMDISIRSLFKD